MGELTDGLREEHDAHPVRTDARERYDLEGLWGDAARVKSKSKPANVKLTSRQASKK